MTLKPYIAIKPLTYATRHFVAGKLFEASEQHGKLLVAIKKARLPTEDELKNRGKLAAPPARVVEKAKAATPALSEKSPEDDLPALREAYSRTVGKRPFPGWDADELRRRMADAATTPQS